MIFVSCMRFSVQTNTCNPALPTRLWFIPSAWLPPFFQPFHREPAWARAAQLGKWQGRTRLCQCESSHTLSCWFPRFCRGMQAGQAAGLPSAIAALLGSTKGSPAYGGTRCGHGDLVLQCSWSSCPICSGEFCRACGRAVQAPVEHSEGLDQVWLAQNHPAGRGVGGGCRVWHGPLSPVGNGILCIFILNR